MESISGVLKEVFFQDYNDGIPSHWVVFYWPEESSPLLDTHEAQYFNSYEECEEFEKTLTDYEDWCSSQEEPLSTQ